MLARVLHTRHAEAQVGQWSKALRVKRMNEPACTLGTRRRYAPGDTPDVYTVSAIHAWTWIPPGPLLQGVLGALGR